MEISDDDLTEIHYIIAAARQKSEIKEDVATEPQLPTQPLLIGVANLTRTGCGSYSKLLRMQQVLKNHRSDREIRWHRELQCTSGIEFRNRVYSFTASIKYENKIKWLQYQINRNSLFTNYKVNKFRPDISPLCVFCSQVENFPKFELVSHLFYDCDFVLNFWQNLNIWLATLDINIPLDRVKLLFGVLTEPSNSVVNFTILCSKSFIWRSKFSTKELSLASFQKYFLHKLTDLKHVNKMIGKENKFEVWNDIYDYLSRLPE